MSIYADHGSYLFNLKFHPNIVFCKVVVTS